MSYAEPLRLAIDDPRDYSNLMVVGGPRRISVQP
jgi:hypothetical protein